MIDKLHSKLIDYLRTKKWFRDLCYRVILVYRLHTEIGRKKRRLRIFNTASDTNNGYWRLMTAQKINKLTVKYNETKFWFQKRKDPFVLTKQYWYYMQEHGIH